MSDRERTDIITSLHICIYIYTYIHRGTYMEESNRADWSKEILAWTNQPTNRMEQRDTEISYPEILKRNPQVVAPLCPGWRREQEEACDDGSSEPWSVSRAGDINQQLARCVRATPLLIPDPDHIRGTGTGNGWEEIRNRPDANQRGNKAAIFLFYSHEIDWLIPRMERTEKYYVGTTDVMSNDTKKKKGKEIAPDRTTQKNRNDRGRNSRRRRGNWPSIYRTEKILTIAFFGGATSIHGRGWSRRNGNHLESEERRIGRVLARAGSRRDGGEPSRAERRGRGGGLMGVLLRAEEQGRWGGAVQGGETCEAMAQRSAAQAE